MTPEQLQDAIGEVRDDYIRDAHAAKKSAAWVRYVAIAACLALVLAAVPVALSLRRETPPITGPETVPVTVETTAATETTTTATAATDPTTIPPTTAATTAATTTAHIVTLKHAVCLTDGLTPRKVDLPDKNSNLLDAYSSFAFRLALKTCDGNSVLSPLSIYAALSMAESGATDKTLKEFEKVLGIKSDALDREMAALLSGLEEDDTLTMANSVWVANQYDYVKPEYLQKMVDCYAGEVFGFDGLDPDFGYVADANRWIGDKTKGRIDKLLEKPKSLEDAATVLLLNALTYDNRWEMQCCGTQRKSFFNADGTDTRDVPFLHYDSKGNAYDFPYLLGDTFDAVFVPYANGDWFVGLAPIWNDDEHRYHTPEEVLQDLLSVGFSTYLGEKVVSHETFVSIEFPTFTEETRYDLKNSLQQMGLSRAFGDDAEFYRIATPPTRDQELKIGGVFTKSRFELTEEGVTASAGSAVVLRQKRGGEPMPPNVQVSLIHPFVYMVLDGETNLPLFIGTRDHF